MYFSFSLMRRFAMAIPLSAVNFLWLVIKNRKRREENCLSFLIVTSERDKLMKDHSIMEEVDSRIILTNGL